MSNTDSENFSSKSLYSKMIDGLDSQIDKHFENFVFSFKIIIIILFIIWVCVFIAKMILQYKMKKNNDSSNTTELSKVTKILNIINDINYYLILIFTLIIAFVMLFKLYPYAKVVITSAKKHSKAVMNKVKNRLINKSMKTDSEQTHLQVEKAEIPTPILSLTWWLLLYFVFIIIIITIDKETKRENAAYYL